MKLHLSTKTGGGEAMLTPSQILAETTSVLLIDWPSREVPAALAAAGLAVTVKGGPGPDSYSAWELTGGQVSTRPLGGPPGHAGLVCFHRPFSELPSIIALAREVGARALWRQSGLAAPGVSAPDGVWVPGHERRQGRDLAAAAGLSYVDDVYIVTALAAARPA
jgi:hypothetical protein